MKPHPLYLFLPGLLVGCADFQARIDTGLDESVRHRLERPEHLDLPAYARGTPETLEAGVARIKEKPPVSAETTPTEPGVAAPAHLDLALADARAKALKNNLDLAVARIDPAIAATVVSEEEAKFDDLIFAKAKFSRKDTPPYDAEVAKFTDVDPLSPLNGETVKLTEIAQTTEYLDVEAGISIPLRTGAKVTLSVPFDQKQSFKGVRSDQYRSALRFSISQPLLREAGPKVNVAGIRIARYEQAMTTLKTRLQAIRVLAAVDKAYWTLWSAWGELDVRR
ncbi:TolC family protein, partial [Candidatus Woesearchaeota archaeon]|nr:TolC family protein [Candidatus Woesearchaeota archaeon]